MCDRKPPASQITITQSIREQCHFAVQSDKNQIHAKHKRNVKLEQLEDPLGNSRQLISHSKPVRNKDNRLGQIMRNIKREREELSDSSYDTDFETKNHSKRGHARSSHYKNEPDDIVITNDISLELNELSKQRRLRRLRKEKEKLLSKTTSIFFLIFIYIA